MKLIRFEHSGRSRYGIVQGGVVHALARSPFSGGLRRGVEGLEGEGIPLEGLRLLAPVRPSKIVAVGLNYHSHAEETHMPLPPNPLIFLKPPSAVIGPGDTIVRPAGSARVDYEGELGVVIGSRASHVRKEEASEYILGYTCANDVSERRMQKADGQWTRAKGFDTFAPLGPWIETDLDPSDLSITTALNGEKRQSARTSDLIFKVPELVEFIAAVMTLMPGDVISTGTPAGIGPMQPGDVVEVAIEGIGTLRNPVR